MKNYGWRYSPQKCCIEIRKRIWNPCEQDLRVHVESLYGELLVISDQCIKKIKNYSGRDGVKTFLIAPWKKNKKKWKEWKKEKMKRGKDES